MRRWELADSGVCHGRRRWAAVGVRTSSGPGKGDNGRMGAAPGADWRAAPWLEEDRGRLKSILDSALDAMITIDDQGIVVEFNNVACVLFGYERDLAIGKDLKTLIIPSEQHAMHEAGLKRFRETSEGPILNQRIEVSAVNKQGHEFPVELAIIPFMHEGNQYFTSHSLTLSTK